MAVIFDELVEQVAQLNGCSIEEAAIRAQRVLEQHGMTAQITLGVPPRMPAHLERQLLDALMYHLPMDVRGKVMREVPEAYNAYHGREIVQVVRTSDGTPIAGNEEQIADARAMLQFLKTGATTSPRSS